MVKPIHIPATTQTPEVKFDPEIGYFEINGRSVMLDVDEFYRPLLEQFEEYLSSHPPSVKVVFKLHCFSFTSLKRIMFFMYELKGAKQRGCDVEVIWKQLKGEDDLTEIAEELSRILKMTIIEKERPGRPLEMV